MTIAQNRAKWCSALQHSGLTVVGHAVLLERGGEDEPELVAELHGVDPAVDVQDQVHLEGLGLAVQPRATVELLALGVDVLHVEDVLEQHPRHLGRSLFLLVGSKVVEVTFRIGGLVDWVFFW